MSAPAPRDSAAFDVREALSQPGCPICGLALRAVGRLLQSLAYEQVNDPALRAELRRARGFCTRHAYRWLREARSVLGTALIYRDVLRASLRDLEAAASPAGRRGGLLGALLGEPKPSSAAACPACRAQRAAEERYLGALLASLAADGSAAAAFASSAGLCRVHALAALRHRGPGAEQVRSQTRRRLEQLLANLDEVIRKEDYRFRDEPRSDAERTAPQRAVAWAAGAEGLVAHA